MRKIRTLIAHNDETVTNNIVNNMKNLDYVEVVGTCLLYTSDAADE